MKLTVSRVEFKINNLSKLTTGVLNKVSLFFSSLRSFPLKIIEDEQHHKEEEAALSREMEKEEDFFVKRRENYIRMKKALENDQSIYRDKVKENDELKTRINMLQIDLSSKQEILKNKVRNCTELSTNAKKSEEKLAAVIEDARKKGFIIVDNEKENELRTSNVLPPPPKLDSFFVRYENDVNLSRIVEQNESNLSPPYSLLDRSRQISEEKKEVVRK